MLKLLRKETATKLDKVKALCCWGALLPISDLKNILKAKSINFRLAGLNLLFKSHLLNAKEILELVDDLLFDFREDVVIEAIKLLQRRDEEKLLSA